MKGISDGTRQPQGLLRFLTCGSVDDGKSTLIGRMLYDAGHVFADQVETLRRDTYKHGTTGDDPYDFALLMDGLEAEREQGITIDVAYRYFRTSERTFVVADAPGHEQYTRNMATAASNADLAVLLLDARKGVVSQTKRHSAICSLFGIRHVVLAVNKMDLVGFSGEVFHRLTSDYLAFATPLGFSSIMPIPISARFGDNIASRSDRMTWFKGSTFLEHLEAIDVEAGRTQAPFRFPVQWVNRPGPDFRGLAGTVVSGRVSPGDRITVAGSKRGASISRIVTYDGDLSSAQAGDAVTLVLDDEIDIGRGDLLIKQERDAGECDLNVTDQFAAHLLWMDEKPLLPGRSYLLRHGTVEVVGRVTALKERLEIATLRPLPARTLAMNEIGVCNVATATPIAFEAFQDNPVMGSFMLIDRSTNATVAAGIIDFALRRAANVRRQHFSVDRSARTALKGHRPFSLWFTGLSGSGKTTIADRVAQMLHDRGVHTYILDGDNLRCGLNRDLGFTDADRVENIRRAGEVARLMADAGLAVICSFISPFRAERRMVRELFPAEEFVEVFVDTPIDECRRRDPKGLYRRADKGLIANFTGIDSPYEPPEAAEVVLSTSGRDPDRLAADLVSYLDNVGLL